PRRVPDPGLAAVAAGPRPGDPRPPECCDAGRGRDDRRSRSAAPSRRSRCHGRQGGDRRGRPPTGSGRSGGSLRRPSRPPPTGGARPRRERPPGRQGRSRRSRRAPRRRRGRGGRLVHRPRPGQHGAELDTAIREMVDAWATDALAGHEVAMYAWRRTNVDALNRRARDVWALAGRLSGSYVRAPGGRCYSVGDRIVTLAPGEDGHLVTSQQGVVIVIDPRTQTVTARMDDDTVHGFTRTEMASDRLAHGYALTVHRSQGETVDIAHRLEDGGGRELAYV